MGKIAVEGMHFHEYHGFYPEERYMGNNFVVDVYLTTGFDKAAKGDDLEGTINYQTIYLAVELIMREPVKLIETLLNKIIERLKFQFAGIQDVTVRISKLNPNIGGPVDRVYVESKKDFSKECPRCGKKFIDYNDDNCWCKKEKIFSITQDTLKERFGGCVCPACVKEFSA